MNNPNLTNQECQPNGMLENTVRGMRSALKTIIMGACITLASLAYTGETHAQSAASGAPACAADQLKNVDGAVKKWLAGTQDAANAQNVRLQLAGNNCTASDVGINQVELDRVAGNTASPATQTPPATATACQVPTDLSEAFFPDAMNALEGLNEADINTIYGPNGVLSRVLQNKREKKKNADALADKAGTAARKLFNLEPDALKKAVKAAEQFMKDTLCFTVDPENDESAINWDMPDETLKDMFILLKEKWDAATDEAKARAKKFYDEAELYKGMLFDNSGAKKADAPDIEGLAYITMSAAYNALLPTAEEERTNVAVAKEEAEKAKEEAEKAKEKADTAKEEAAKKKGGSNVAVSVGAYGDYRHGWHENGTVNGVSEGVQVEVCSDFDGRVNVCGGGKAGAAHLNGTDKRADKENKNLTHGVEASLFAKMPIKLMGNRLTLGPTVEGGIINKGGYVDASAEMKVRLYKKLWLSIRAGYEHLFNVNVKNGSRLNRELPGETSTDGINTGVNLEWKI